MPIWPASSIISNNTVCQYSTVAQCTPHTCDSLHRVCAQSRTRSPYRPKLHEVPFAGLVSHLAHDNPIVQPCVLEFPIRILTNLDIPFLSPVACLGSSWLKLCFPCSCSAAAHQRVGKLRNMQNPTLLALPASARPDQAR